MRRCPPLLVVLAIIGCRDGKTVPPAPETRAEPRRDPAPAELRPHPDYPTAALAGTEELFLLEEPPRGPHVTDVKLPDPSQLKFTESAFCELTTSRLVCAGHPKAGVPSLHWNVGRSGDRIIVAERTSPTNHVLETLLFDWDA